MTQNMVWQAVDVPQEYVAINSMLDQINSCLDDLEERNDALTDKLQELLESNRQARLEFREQLNGTPAGEQQPAPPEQDPAASERPG
ncbi:UPF0184 protein C9orf16 homolog isoform X2 [Conger conger]|uniref:UPF0184 protein C9orf16 homolog isoform X2 n=1 Tax=Conger conger TaxID=82655 RepID=UPI002A5A3EAD|nr:UPF0184 protein C9orf16 homolog isoform X2 [Conger conger]